MRNRNKFLTIALLLVLLVWVGGWLIVDYVIYPSSYGEGYLTNRGTFGDKFEFVDSLFSAVGLAGIIYSIIIQKEELFWQRKEITETKDEFDEQNFQTTFFNLLKMQREIADEISCEFFFANGAGVTVKAKGRQFFSLAKKEIILLLEAIENYEKEGDKKGILKYYNITEKIATSLQEKSDTDRVDVIVESLFNKYDYAIGHYFRHLYYILKLVNKKQYSSKKNKEIDINSFTNFLKAQISTPELVIIYYSCFEYDKFKELAMRYRLLEHLTTKDLIRATHKVDGITLKLDEYF